MSAPIDLSVEREIRERPADVVLDTIEVWLKDDPRRTVGVWRMGTLGWDDDVTTEAGASIAVLAAAWEHAKRFAPDLADEWLSMRVADRSPA